MNRYTLLVLCTTTFAAVVSHDLKTDFKSADDLKEAITNAWINISKINRFKANKQYTNKDELELASLEKKIRESLQKAMAYVTDIYKCIQQVSINADHRQNLLLNKIKNLVENARQEISSVENDLANYDEKVRTGHIGIKAKY